MNYTQLNTALDSNLVSGTLTIASGDLTTTIDELIEYCYDDVAIVINNATKVEDPVNEITTVTGDSDYLNATGMSVTATFSVDVNGDVQVACIYTLPADWVFSDSFTGLPTITDHAEPISYYAMAGEDEITIAEATALDRFDFEYPTLVVTTIAGSETITIDSGSSTTVDAELQWGINFVGQLQPDGMLLAVENLFNHTDVLPVYGTIRRPLTTETASDLNTVYPYTEGDAVVYPWDAAPYAGTPTLFSKGFPGILLQAALGVSYTVRTNVSFTADFLYIYTPLEDTWVVTDTNPAFVSIQAYTGSLEITGNDFDPIVMNMVSAIDVGRDFLSLEANFTGVTVGNILHLAGLTDDDTQNPAGNLPDTLSQQLGALELTNAGVSVNYYNDLYTTPNVTVVDQMHFTAGFPNLSWQVWEDHIVVDAISCSFAFDYPFNDPDDSFPWQEPATRIGLTANLTLEGVSFSVYGDLYRSDRDYHEFYAEMDDAQTLDLDTIVGTYASGVPVSFNSLTINTFGISIIPNISYSMVMTAAESPDFWQIDLPGSVQLDIQDIAFLINYLKDHPESSEGSLGGELSGTFTLSNDPNDASTDTSHDVTFSLAAAVHKDVEGIGWIFTGSGSSASGSIDLTDMLSNLAGKFGITTTVPTPISSFNLENLAIAFDTGSNDLSFSGETTFNIGGTDFDITAQVDISHLQDGTTQRSFSGNLTLGSENPRTFSLSFSDSHSSLMLASYSDTAGQDDFDVGDFINSMLATDAAPSGLTITLNNAFMAYLNDNTSTKFAVSVDVGNGIDLSNLPLVGKLYPKGKTISLSYQLQYASDTFTGTEVANINTLLPTGVHPLLTDVNGEMTSGLDLAVSMQLGEDIIPFDLDLAASGSSADPNLNSYTDGNGDVTIPDGTDPVVSKTPGSSSDSTKWFDIQKSVGPVHFNRVGVAYSGGNLSFALDASFSMGGLEISLDGLSVSSPLTSFNPTFDLKGIGIDYKNPVLEIGAAFLREHIDDPVLGSYDEYDGLALLRMKELSLSAIGSYAYVNGQPSLFLYAALNYPLGGPPFFFVTGLSLGFGYNRALRMPSVDKVLEFPLVAEAMNGKSLSASAGKDTLTAELEAIHSYIPVSIGDMFLAAGISFTTFKLIDSTILLAASFGNRFELDLLGVSTLVVPPETSGKTSLAVIQMTLKGAFIPDEGFVGLSGQLTSASYILSKDCHLTGGFAFYSWYSGDHAGDFIATVGGYHPHFSKPSHYPSVPRLAFSWNLDSHTHIKGDAYFALCAHALMAGGHFEAVFEEGNLKAWYKVGADFLVAWKPFHYEASVYVNIGGSYTYHFFGTHHITVDVGADVNIWGPEFGGHATVHLWICSIDVDFGAHKDTTPDPITWADFNQSFLPESNLCSVSVSSGLVSKGATDDDLGVINPKELVLLTDTFIPSKAVTWGDGTGDQPDSGDWNSNFGIGSMDISASDLSCSQTITVEKYNEASTTWVDYSSHFTYTVNTKKAPAGLWGEQLSPGVNDTQFIEDTFSGLQIVPGNEPTPGISNVINRSFVRYETSTMADAIVWETRAAFTDAALDETTTRSTINSGIKTNTSRDTLLNDLGISSTIDLTDSIADALILTPQLAQTV